MLKNLSHTIRHHQRFVRYAVGGGLAALIDLCCLYVFTDLFGIYYLLSQVLAFVVSFAFGFWFQKHITFRKKAGSVYNQGTLFLFFQLIGICINILILWIAVEHFGAHYLIGSIFAKAVVFLRNYGMNAKFNFK